MTNKRYPKKEPITNTANEAPDWPTVPGFPAGLLDNGAGILRQEARGTQELSEARGARLPTQGTSTPDEIERCKAIGIKLGPVVSGDPLFRQAQLPAGWTTAPSHEDSRTTDILDQHGNRRGYVWYKAASYDRAAYLVILTRYWPEGDYSDQSYFCVIVTDRATGKPIWGPPAPLTRPQGQSSPAVWKAYDKAKNDQLGEARAWLDTNYPAWKSPAAYWP